MSGEDFINSFVSAMYKPENRLKQVYSKHRTEYTTAINGIIRYIFCEEHKDEYEDKYFPEYFRIDHTVWTSTKCISIDGVKIYNWCFDFAIEHENDCTDWTYEMLKLSFVDAKVRIVIGYVDRERVADREETIIREQANYIGDISPDDEFYVLLLNNKYDDTNQKDPFDPRCYRISKSGDDVSVEQRAICKC